MNIYFDNQGNAVQILPDEFYSEGESVNLKPLTNEEFSELTDIYFVEGTAREAAEWLDRVYFDGVMYWLED